MVPWPIRNGMWLALAAAWAASPASQGIAEDAAVATVDAFAAAVRQAEIAFNTLVNVRTPFEIGTPGKQGVAKCYVNSADPEDARRRIETMLFLRIYANVMGGQMWVESEGGARLPPMPESVAGLDSFVNGRS